MNAEEVAKRIYRRFHAANPNHSIKVNIPKPASALPAIGVVESLTYSIPKDWPSAKDKSSKYRHEFGDLGGGRNTGAKPLLIDGGRGTLIIQSKPGEPAFYTDDYIRG